MALARGASSNARLKAGIVGCGGRGTQAVANLLTGNENVELVAMADIFEDQLEGSLKNSYTTTLLCSSKKTTGSQWNATARWCS